MPDLDNLVELLSLRALHYPDHTIFTFLRNGEHESEHLTYSLLNRRARAIGAFLQLHQATGQRVLLIYRPGLEYISAFFGCLFAGAVAVPVYPPRANRGLRRLELIAFDSEPAFALTNSVIREQLRRCVSSPLNSVRFLASEEIRDSWTAHWHDPSVKNQALALLQYTSGSTGEPKGVEITHGNLLQNQQAIKEAFQQTEDSIVVGWLPLYHDMGLVGNVLQPVYCASRCVLMSPSAFLQSPIRWLQAISTYRATTSGGPNFAYDLCLRKITSAQIEKLDLSSWRVAFNGSEPVNSETIERFKARFARAGFHREAVHTCYGLAESTLLVSSSRRPRLVSNAGKKVVSCGSAADGHKISIVNPQTLAKCSPGEEGEIWVCGPSVARGYWARPEDSERVFRARIPHRDDARFLRTGDLGFVQGNELFITGRIKDLIVIRGRNHYPQDIEWTAQASDAALRPGSGAAFAVNVDGEERLAVVHEIEPRCCPFYAEQAVSAIRRAVAEEHEIQAYVVVLVRAGSLPRTSSGKIRRYLCREQFLADRLDRLATSLIQSPQASTGEELTSNDLLSIPPEEQRDILERWLLRSISRITGAPEPQLDRNQPLIELGLDSLMATELTHLLVSRFGVGLTVEDLLGGYTVTHLGDSILSQLGGEESRTGTAEVPVVEPLSPDTDLPLTFDQERLWVLDQLQPGSGTYHLSAAIRFTGQLNVAALEQTVDEIVRRQEALRTVFEKRHGTLVQVVRQWRRERLAIVEISGSGDDARGAQFKCLMLEIRRRPFQLAQSPPIRFMLLRLSTRQHVFVLATHHILSDGWSMRVFLREMIDIYRALSAGVPSPLAELEAQPAEYAQWQRAYFEAGGFKRQLDFWKGQISGVVPVLGSLPLRLERPGAEPVDRPAHQEFEIPEHLYQALLKLSSKQGVTLFMTLLAAWEALLHLYTGHRDITVGLPVANRTRTRFWRVFGCFAHPLLLRMDVSPHLKLRELLLLVRSACLKAFAHQEAPFAKVVALLKSGSGTDPSRLVQVMFSLVDTLGLEAELPELAIESLNTEMGTTDIDLFLVITRRKDGLRGWLAYNSSLFETDMIAALANCYENFLTTFAQNPEMRLSDLGVPEPLTRTQLRALQSPHELRIVIAATFSAAPVEDSLSFWLKELEIPSKIEFAPYNQLFQQLLDDDSGLNRNAAGINVLLIRFEDCANLTHWLHDRVALTQSMEQNARELADALQSAIERSGASYLVCLCPAPPNLLADLGYAHARARIENEFAAAIQSCRGTYLLRGGQIADLYDVPSYYDTIADKLGQVPYTDLFFTALGTAIARAVYAIAVPPYKVIVLDCDEALWSGYCGEVGPGGIAIDSNRIALQQFMLEQHKAGRLLCLCSKNQERDVLVVFERPDMVLRRSHFASARINWQPKSENIKSIAEELQLGLDSFIFLDDDPLECAEVRANCPEVLAIQLPSTPADIPGLLRALWSFDCALLTSEDSSRTHRYQQEAARRRAKDSFPTLADFLASLDLKIRISPMVVDQLARVSQLTYRTNQFNMTTRRRSEAELRQLLGDGRHECLVTEVSDRFGDYGLVGVLIFETTTDSLVADTFLVSCRALGRGVEHRMVARLGEVAVQRGIEMVNLFYFPSDRNLPARTFVEKIGSLYQERVGEASIFRFPASAAGAITYQPASFEDLPREKSASRELASTWSSVVTVRAERNAWLVKSAHELRDAAQILAAVRSQRQVVTGHGSATVVPRTPLEKELATIWAELLHVDRVGVYDDFFQLGGNSLTVVQLISAIHRTLNVEIPIKLIFDSARTLETQASAIARQQIAQADASSIAAALREMEDLSDDEVLELLESEDPHATAGGQA